MKPYTWLGVLATSALAAGMLSGSVASAAGVSLASVMGPGCCHEEGTTLGHE